MTTEKTREPAGSAISVDNDGGGGDASAAAASAAAALSPPVAYFRDALPAPLLEALRADAEGLACCPNFWVPRSVLSGEEPAAAAFEQAAAALARRCLSAGRWRRRRTARRRKEEAKETAEEAKEEGGSPQIPPPLHPLLSVYRETTARREDREEEEEEEEVEEEEEEELLVSGAECWLQLYEGGRGLDPHYDKDEEASAKGERPLRHPRVSTVVYLNGGDEEGRGEKTRNRFGATVVINQRLHPRSGAPLPAVPTSSALLWPRRGAAAAFDGRLAHCVLSSSVDDDGGGGGGGDDGGGGGGDASASKTSSPSSPSAFDEGKRATVLFNFWCGRAPGGVLRVTEEDIVAAGLSRPVGDDDGDGGSREPRSPTPVAPAAVSVPAAGPASLCLLDDLLRPRGALGRPFVVVSHPGYELVEAEVHEEGGDEGEGGEGEGEELGTKKAAAASAAARGAQIVFLPLSEDSDSD